MSRRPAGRQERRSVSAFRTGGAADRQYMRGYADGRQDASAPPVQLAPARPRRPLAAQLVCPPDRRPVEQPDGLPEGVQVADVRRVVRLLRTALDDGDYVTAEAWGKALHMLVGDQR